MVNIESLFSKGPNVGWAKLDRNLLPSKIYDLDGGELLFGRPLPRGVRAPAIFKNKIIAGDLIPGTSWGSSLANLLTKSAWDALRFPVIDRNSGVCEFCGDYVGRSLEVHEIWSYSNIAEEAELSTLGEDELCFGYQRLDGLVGVCRFCHECFHYGLAVVKNRDAIVKRRLCLINGWTESQVKDYIDVMFERHEVLSKQNWLLDMSLIASLGVEGLLVSRAWQRDETSPEILWKDNHYGTSITLIANCKWRLTNEKSWSFKGLEDE